MVSLSKRGSDNKLKMNIERYRKVIPIIKSHGIELLMLIISCLGREKKDLKKFQSVLEEHGMQNSENTMS